MSALRLGWRRFYDLSLLLLSLVLGETGLSRRQLWLEWWSSRARVLEFIWQDCGAALTERSCSADSPAPGTQEEELTRIWLVPADQAGRDVDASGRKRPRRCEPSQLLDGECQNPSAGLPGVLRTASRNTENIRGRDAAATDGAC